MPVTTETDRPWVWPASAHDPGHARGALSALVQWITEHGLPELPPDHRALAEQPFGLFLRLEVLEGSPWSHLQLSQHVALGLGTWATWTATDGTEGACFVPPGVAWALSASLQEVLRALPGDAIELRYALAGSASLLPHGTWVHPDGWWSAWKGRTLDGDEGPSLGDVYEKWLYPRVLRAIEPLFDGRPRRVLDVCGGDGMLARRLVQAHPEAEAVVLERNRAACAAAAARGLEVRCADVRDGVAWEGLVDVDLVLMVGAVQVNVMRRDEALAVVTHARDVLALGGVMVVTGWSACLLDAVDFREVGLRVVNTAVPPMAGDPNPRQLLVAIRQA